MLCEPEGLPLLVAAADCLDCPKRDHCANVLEDYSRRIVGWDRTDVYPALRDAAAYAATGRDPRTRRWAEYVARLFAYRERPCRVNRSKAERMAVDLLSGPILEERRMAAGADPDRLTVQFTSKGQHWKCFPPGAYPTFLYINRRTGRFRLAAFDPLSAAELRTLI